MLAKDLKNWDSNCPMAKEEHKHNPPNKAAAMACELHEKLRVFWGTANIYNSKNVDVSIPLLNDEFRHLKMVMLQLEAELIRMEEEAMISNGCK